MLLQDAQPRLLLRLRRRLRRHESEVPEVHVKLHVDGVRRCAILGLGCGQLLLFGLEVHGRHVDERVAEAVELADRLADVAADLEGLDELGEPREVVEVGGLDDVAEYDDEGDKRRV